MAKKNKQTTNLPVVFEVYGVEGLTKKSISMYILHDRSVGVCFSNIYRRILHKSETRPRADMITRVCPRKKVKEASAMLSYSPVPREMAGSVTF